MLINDLGAIGKIVDDYSEMTLVDNQISAEIEPKWRYFSLIAISGTACGVTITNAKYNGQFSFLLSYNNIKNSFIHNIQMK